ncbi:MAG: Hsp33 family molecular chaperone [Alphaproteobacteria bacterium]|nr:Hsp33 family molecular chaperone [Alphaproteobacteria bacterium]
MPEGDTSGTGAADDLIQPFQIESHSLRGRLVRLGPAIDTILSAHDYPEPVATLLGETVTLAALFADAMKFEGILTIQTKSDGPVNLLVADVTSTGDVRGYAGFDEEKLAAAITGPVEAPVPMLLGAGYLAFTVDQGPHTERYQGIVELTGATLAECAHHYFRQSEQLDAAIQLAAGRVGADGTGAWRAGGLMLQHVPPEGGKAEHNWDIDAQSAIDGWRESVVLMGTVKSEELLGPRLLPHDLLYRLFHEVGVRAFQTRPLVHSCRCSREKVTNTLASLPRAEVEDCKEEGSDEVVVTCQFCNASYRFDDDALAALYETDS